MIKLGIKLSTGSSAAELAIGDVVLSPRLVARKLP